MVGRQDRQRGVTLVELVVAIVVISIAVGGVLLVMNYTVSRSADPMLQHQAVAIAEAYLEEILLKPFTDPDGGEPEAGRSLFDDVDDYHGLSGPPADQEGTAIAALAGYNVGVAVTAVTLGPVGNTVPALRVAVTVADPRGQALTLTGYRADF
jgi:MSHA pilin protein MshD